MITLVLYLQLLSAWENVMTELELILAAILLSGFLFAAIARFNLYRFQQSRRVLTAINTQQSQSQFDHSSPEIILDNGLHKLFQYFVAGMIIFIGGSATLVDSGALNALVDVFLT